MRRDLREASVMTSPLSRMKEEVLMREVSTSLRASTAAVFSLTLTTSTLVIPWDVANHDLTDAAATSP